MKKIKLMADYYCFPLWHNSSEEIGNIDPDDLPISEKIKKRLNTWSDKYDSILNQDDPASSDFASPEEQVLFVQEGYELAQNLRDELGEEYEIIYYSDY